MNISGRIGAALALALVAQSAFATTVIRDGKQWMQLTETSGWSYNEMASYCSTVTGICTSGTNDSGESLVGWTWADNNDVISLFNSYMADVGTTAGTYLAPHWPYNKSQDNSAWAPLALSEFNETSPTLTIADVVGGFTRNLLTNGPTQYVTLAEISNDHETWYADTARVLWWHSDLANTSNFTAGAWLYTAVGTTPPSPGTTPTDPITTVLPCQSSIPGFGCIKIAATIDPNGVGGATPVYIDPEIAVGYAYSVNETGVFFDSVLIPEQDGLVNGDVLELLVAGLAPQSLVVGTAFDFTDLGIFNLKAFTIQGIDPGLALVPGDPTAFVTGLTFVGADGTPLTGQTDVTVNMNPLTLQVGEPGQGSVPLPATIVLLGCGLAGMGVARRHRRLLGRY